MIKLRMREASELVDIGRIPDLSSMKLNDSVLNIGALTIHALIAESENARKVPLIAQAASGIADWQIRSMGTIGGGLIVADSIGCWPTSLLTAYIKVQVIGPQGSRSIAKRNGIWGRLAYYMMREQVPIKQGNNAKTRTWFRSE